MVIPKPKRQVNRQYLDFVKSRPCVVVHECMGPIDPQHIKTVGSGGSDYMTVSMCRKAHSECHQIGIHTFAAKYGLNLWEEAFHTFYEWAELKAWL